MNKKLFLRKVLVVEILIFVGYYLFGAHGLQAIKCIKNENAKLEDGINAVHKEIASLQYDIKQWDSHLFYKEKIAREQLQLAKEHDEIYYIG